MPAVITRDELRRRVEDLAPQGRSTILVALDGWGGAGKTTLARWLADRLQAVVVTVLDAPLSLDVSRHESG